MLPHRGIHHLGAGSRGGLSGVHAVPNRECPPSSQGWGERRATHGGGNLLIANPWCPMCLCSWDLPFPTCTSELQRGAHCSSGLNLTMCPSTEEVELPTGGCSGCAGARDLLCSSLLGWYFYSLFQFLGKLTHLAQLKLSEDFAVCQGFGSALWKVRMLPLRHRDRINSPLRR